MSKKYISLFFPKKPPQLLGRFFEIKDYFTWTVVPIFAQLYINLTALYGVLIQP